MNQDQILETFIGRGLIDKDQADDIKIIAEQGGKTIARALEDYGVVENIDQFYATIADEIGAEYLDLSGFEPPKELLAVIPAGMARLHGALPVHYGADGLQVALVDPLDPQVLEDLRFALGKPVLPVVARSEQIENLISEHYGGDSDSMDEMLNQLGISAGSEGEELDVKALEQEANSAPIIRYVDLVLYQAIKEKASDIHFEPFEHDFRIRYRVDGSLYEMAPPPLHLKDSIISRIKVMSNMNIAERRVPQDGRIMKEVDGRSVDMRVSSLPIQHGESVVLRVLDRSSIDLDLEDLGMPPDLKAYIEDTVSKPNGIFICTGPTGAGKTTTLYASLRRVNTVDVKILTAEDPVEYDVDGIIQVPVNDAIGLTFSRVLRAFLRQDPDKIMVGEMRDLETAQIAIQASLTGHLVFSTLHTNDAPGAVTRLVDMGTEPFLVAATLEGVLAQRLLRTICKDCRTAYQPTESILLQLGLSPADVGDKEFYTGAGCESCSQTGYKGRTGLYELLDMNDAIRELITQRAPSLKIRHKAIEMGMIGLREDGLRNIYSGKTTIEEVLKYT